MGGLYTCVKVRKVVRKVREGDGRVWDVEEREGRREGVKGRVKGKTEVKEREGE